MKELIPIVQLNEVEVVDSRIIANELGVQHKNLIETIRKYQSKIEEHFGRVAFETEPLETVGGVQNSTIAYLTEDQAIFVGSLSRNTETVVRFKAKLVKSFQAARKALQQLSNPKTELDLIIESALILRETRKDIEELKAWKDEQERTKNLATKELLIAERSTETIPEETLRTKIRRLINRYCEARNADQQSVWRVVYDRLYYRYGVSLRAIVKRKNESTLDVAERLGHLDKIWAICSNELV